MLRAIQGTAVGVQKDISNLDQSIMSMRIGTCYIAFVLRTELIYRHR